jgi:hypothetical protein
MINYFIQQVGNYVAYGLSTDTKPSLPPDGCMFVETDTGNIYNSIDDVWSLTSGQKTIKGLSDLPTPISGVITLEDNVTYQINGTVDIGTNRIECGIKNTIKGNDRQNDILISSTSGNMFTMNNSSSKLSLIFDNLTIKSTVGSLISVSGGSTEQVTFISTTISNSVTGGTLSGVAFSMRTSSLSSAFSSGGFTFSGTNTSLVLRDSTVSNSSGTSFNISSATFTSSVLISRNFILSNATQTFLNATSVVVTIAGQIALNVFSGSGTYVTGITDQTDGWLFSDNQGIRNKMEFDGLTKITVSTTEPTSPNSGDLWIDIT